MQKQLFFDFSGRGKFTSKTTDMYILPFEPDAGTTCSRISRCTSKDRGPSPQQILSDDKNSSDGPPDIAPLRAWKNNCSLTCRFTSKTTDMYSTVNRLNQVLRCSHGRCLQHFSSKFTCIHQWKLRWDISAAGVAFCKEKAESSCKMFTKPFKLNNWYTMHMTVLIWPEQTQKSSRNKFCHEWSLWSQTSSFKQMEAWSKICEIQDLQKKKNHHFRAHLSYVAHMSVYIRPLGIHGNSMFLRCLCFQSHEVILVVSWGAEGRKEMWLVRVFSLSNMQECRVSS